MLTSDFPAKGLPLLGKIEIYFSNFVSFANNVNYVIRKLLSLEFLLCPDSLNGNC